MPSAPDTGGPSRAAAWAIATLCGVGHFPIAPGTVATAATIPIYWAAHLAGGPYLVLGLAMLTSILGVAAAGAHETRLGYHDPSQVVVDEVAGTLITMLFVAPSWGACAAGFLVFRALDVLKPWPASWAEGLPGGWGIMADDVICGVMGCAILHVGLFLWR